MDPIIITNVFTPEQVEILKTWIAKHNNPIDIVSERGRADIHLNNDLEKQVLLVVEKHFGNNLYLSGITYSEYNDRYGIPNLPRHKDPNYPDGALTFDYLLDSNIYWPVCVEDGCYNLSNNDAIIFDPRNSWHERPEKIFENEDYVKIVFFYFWPK